MKPLKRIAFVNPHSDPLGKIGEPDCGGQCIVEKELMRWLTEADPDIRVESYTRAHGGKPLEEKIGERATAYRIPCSGDAFIRKEDLYEHLPEFQENLLELWREKGYHYDILHGHYADGGALAHMVSGKLGIPYVFTAHSLGKVKQKDLPDENQFRYSVRIPWEQTVIDHAHGIIALNEIEKNDYYLAMYGADAEKIQVIPNGIDLAKFPHKSLAQMTRAPEERIVFTTGRLDPRKGFGLLARTLSTVASALEERGLRVRYRFPKGGGDLNDQEQAVLRAIQDNVPLPFRDRLDLFPRLSDPELLQAYQEADVFVCASPYEPFGLVILEAMAVGTPVVATRFGGPANILDDGLDGHLVDPHDTAEFANKLVSLLEDDETRRIMGERARQKVEAHYAWASVADATLGLYRMVVGNAG